MIAQLTARQQVERFFSVPFTDYQWSLIAAHGYEDAVTFGSRSAEGVAAELQELMDAARLASERPPEEGREPPLTWEQMERSVLGRMLLTGAPESPPPVIDVPGPGERAKRLAEKRERRQKQRPWYLVLIAATAVLVVALIIMLVVVLTR